MTLPAVPAAEPASLRAETVYNEAAMAARLLYRTLETEEKNPTSLFWPENIIRKIWLLLHEGSPRLLALTLRSTPDHFLFSHVANMTVLSMRLGLAVGLEEDDLMELCCGVGLPDTDPTLDKFLNDIFNGDFDEDC